MSEQTSTRHPRPAYIGLEDLMRTGAAVPDLSRSRHARLRLEVMHRIGQLRDRLESSQERPPSRDGRGVA